MTDWRGEIDSSTRIAGDFNITLSVTDRIFSQKINKEIEDLNNSIIQLNTIDIYKTVRLTTDCAFFSSTD